MTQRIPDEMVVLSLMETDTFVLIGDPDEVGLKQTETLQTRGKAGFYAPNFFLAVLH